MLANNEFKWKESQVIHRKGEGWSFSVLHRHYLKTFPKWKLFREWMILLNDITKIWKEGLYGKTISCLLHLLQLNVCM